MEGVGIGFQVLGPLGPRGNIELQGDLDRPTVPKCLQQAPNVCKL